jgi:hypothetical protein
MSPPGQEPQPAHEPFDLETAPLDEYEWGSDWGGDGSDLSRPVRAHVLAALVPTSAPYEPPLDALLRLGDPREVAQAGRLWGLPITEQHLPELVRMARDRALNTADSEALEVWAPVHALAAIGELDPVAALPDLLPLFDFSSDWLTPLLEESFVKVGAAALPVLAGYLHDPTRWGYGRAHAADALTEIAKAHPELHAQVVAALRDTLRDAAHNLDSTNGLIVANLIELGAAEALPEIRHAYAIGQVDELINGDWGRVQADLGVEPDPSDPLLAESARRWQEAHERRFPAAQRAQLQRLFGEGPGELADEFAVLARSGPNTPASAAPPPRPAASAPAKVEQRAKKAKSKRKMEKASRKANSKKKR